MISLIMSVALCVFPWWALLISIFLKNFNKQTHLKHHVTFPHLSLMIKAQTPQLCMRGDWLCLVLLPSLPCISTAWTHAVCSVGIRGLRRQSCSRTTAFRRALSSPWNFSTSFSSCILKSHRCLLLFQSSLFLCCYYPSPFLLVIMQHHPPGINFLSF